MKAGAFSQRGAFLLNVATLPIRRDILTGTPMPQAASDTQSQLDFLWPGHGLGVEVARGNPPPLPVVTWWDTVTGLARLLTDIEKMEQARKAEQLTMDHETKRLVGLGINKSPEWKGLDDNFAGYDVLSYDVGEFGTINRMIEVKSTVVSPIKFILTRNEWDQAVKAGPAYLFHVWDMAKTPPVLYERTCAQVALHIPTDNEKGKWKTAEIPLGS
jgi:hypothetical protein